MEEEYKESKRINGVERPGVKEEKQGVGDGLCSFCSIILDNLKNVDTILLSHIHINRRNIMLNNYKPMKIVGYCRGYGLCSKHIQTIKRDNKYRIMKGETIPESLELLRKIHISDI